MAGVLAIAATRARKPPRPREIIESKNHLFSILSPHVKNHNGKKQGYVKHRVEK